MKKLKPQACDRNRAEASEQDRTEGTGQIWQATLNLRQELLLFDFLAQILAHEREARALQCVLLELLFRLENGFQLVHPALVRGNPLVGEHLLRALDVHFLRVDGKRAQKVVVLYVSHGNPDESCLGGRYVVSKKGEVHVSGLFVLVDVPSPL